MESVDEVDGAEPGLAAEVAPEAEPELWAGFAAEVASATEPASAGVQGPEAEPATFSGVAPVQRDEDGDTGPSWRWSAFEPSGEAPDEPGWSLFQPSEERVGKEPDEPATLSRIEPVRRDDVAAPDEPATLSGVEPVKPAAGEGEKTARLSEPPTVSGLKPVKPKTPEPSDEPATVTGLTPVRPGKTDDSPTQPRTRDDSPTKPGRTRPTTPTRPTEPPNQPGRPPAPPTRSTQPAQPGKPPTQTSLPGKTANQAGPPLTPPGLAATQSVKPPGNAAMAGKAGPPNAPAQPGQANKSGPPNAPGAPSNTGPQGKTGPLNAPGKPGTQGKPGPNGPGNPGLLTTPGNTGVQGKTGPLATPRKAIDPPTVAGLAPVRPAKPEAQPTSPMRKPEAATSRLQVPPRQPGSYTEEATKRIQLPAIFPMVDPDSRPAVKPVSRPGYPPPEPPRAAPVRIEPKPTKEEDDEPTREAPPRNKKKALLITAAAVVVVAVGVAFGVPQVREKLLGKDTPAVAIQPAPSPVAFTPALKGPSADAPMPTPDGVKNALSGPASAPALGTLTGAVMDASTGTMLWERNSTTPIMPASTAKVLTSAAALLKLDRGQQFVTRVVAGKEPGSVVLVGGGDPTISSLPAGKNSVYEGAAHLDDLVAQVKANAGGKVTQVYLDVTRYTGDGLAQGWIPGDVPGGYIAPIVPAMMDGGRQNPALDVSARSGQPARTLATELAKRLGATVAAKPEITAEADAKVLGEIRSAPLAELIDNYLQISDNVLAETVAREVAKAVGEEPSFAGVSRSTLKVLQENGFDTTGAALIDGSGLSTSDHVPARLLASVLAVAAGPDGKDPRTAKLRSLLGGLPVAGGSGTLEPRFQPGTPSAVGRGWVRAKTGTLSGVNSLAGVVLDADGRILVFAMMTNGTAADAARPALDAVASTLRSCGCR
ncbi:D-alanyl-D-alanine carboxypeptidase/D-alanyl-D-alanine-endopeptidase [Actinocrispum sp. NPDC049592]|uniref:D-alanyl-D-alanine carboxypeptidase/D-alanyl-D-alanine endopeptidase n=1 Tax=Actinocrispum sp. NPDC049592 TaxID=3154835 RepID=UPI00343DC81B